MRFSEFNLKILLLFAVASVVIAWLSVRFYMHGRQHEEGINIVREQLANLHDFELKCRILQEKVRAYDAIANTASADVLEGFRAEIRLAEKDYRTAGDLIADQEGTADLDRLRRGFDQWVDQSVYYRPKDRMKVNAASDISSLILTTIKERNAFLAQQESELVREINQDLRKASLMGLASLLLFVVGFYCTITFYHNPVMRLAERAEEVLDIEGMEAPPIVRFRRSFKELLARFKQSGEAQYIVNSITEGLIIVSPDGLIKMVNKSILSMLGYREEELVGNNFSDIYVKVKSLHVQGFFKRKETYREEELFKTREGKIIPVRFSSSFLFDANMEVIGFVCIAKDITKEKQAEEELQKQSEWFKVTLASIGDAVITTDNDGRINFMNSIAADLTGWSGSDALDQELANVFPIFHKDTREPLHLPRGKELLKSSDFHVFNERTLMRRDGSEIEIDKVFAPIRSASGNVHGMVVVFRDITESRRVSQELLKAKEKAENALKVKSQFLANMSHEIRTPMNGIIGMTDLLLDTGLNKEQRDVAEVVRNSGEALLNLINDILDFSKIEAGKLQLEIVEFDIRITIDDVGDLMAQKAQQKGIELVILVRHNVPMRIKGDPGRLRQILLNLLTNAIKFTEEGEVVLEVKLDQEEEGSCVLLFQITDTGIGISEERQERLFKPFSQADASTTRKYGGTGLGLAICRELCEAMGGDIAVTSEIGKGSVFSFMVPFETRAKLDRESFPPQESLKDLRILVAEGNEANRLALRYQLEHSGCVVGEVGDSDKIIPELDGAKERGEPYQMLILDFNLCSEASQSFANSLKSDPRFGKLGILLVTSIPFRLSAIQSGGEGFDGYLSKPIKLKQLYDSVSTIMGFVSDPQHEKNHELVTDIFLQEHERQVYQILIAEDNPVNQKVTASLLKKAGYRCDIASNGVEALEAMARNPYDLILMDCQMPEKDGFQTTREIRILEEDRADGRAIPIIAMTANALKGDKERCLEAGMDDYLSKPVKKKVLYETIDRYLKTVQPRPSS